MIDCAKTLGSTTYTGLKAREACAQGIMPFHSFASIVRHPTIQDVATAARNQHRHFVALGSASGDLNMWAYEMLHLRSIGYDMLCESAVAQARIVADQFNLTSNVGFLCEDARRADLSQCSIAWASNTAWPSQLRSAVEESALRQMPEGAILVTYTEPIVRHVQDDGGNRWAWKADEQLTVETSWDRELTVWVLSKISDQRSEL